MKNTVTPFEMNVAEMMVCVSRVETMNRDLNHTHLSILKFRPRAMPRQDIILETVAEQLSPENAGEFFRGLREDGFRRKSESLGLGELVLRGAIGDYLRGQLSAKCGIVMAWSSEKPTVDPEYDEPAAVALLSDLLQGYIAETGLYIERNYSKWSDDGVRWLNTTTQSYLDQSEVILKETMATLEDPHQFVHVDEVFTTFFMTILQMLDAWIDFPDKMESETRPAELTFEVHSSLCGLIESANLFADTDLLNADASAAAVAEAIEVGAPEELEADGEEMEDEPKQLTRRLSLDTDRRGRDISFDEIANIYRTSRVTISNVVKRMKAHMRAKIEVSALDCDGAFQQSPHCGTVLDA